MDTGLKKQFDIIENKLRNKIITEKQARKLIKKEIKDFGKSYMEYLRNFHTENDISNFKRFFGFYWFNK